ncbi:MAG: HAD family hydrolase [Thermodesulfobacteriota bacterium]
MRALQLVTDCEGPLVLNDHAFELCRDFLKPDGARFFRQVSRYDDYLANLVKKPDYRAGDILKRILPFLKAFGLSNAKMLDYSLKTIQLMPGAAAAYKFLHKQGFPIFALSTGYRQFAEAVGSKLGFAKDRIFSTDLDLDGYSLAKGEAEELRRLKEEIAAAPEMELPPEAASLNDLPVELQEAIGQLDRIFWELIPAMDIGRIYQEVNPLGGEEKARALGDSLAQTGLALKDTIYVGDGLTDVQSFKAVAAEGGLGISFNGDRDAVEAAEVIVVADNAWSIALLACICHLWGKDGVLEVANKGTQSLVLPEAVIEPLMRGLHGHNFSLYAASTMNRDQVVPESAAMRAKLRGQAIAAFG